MDTNVWQLTTSDVCIDTYSTTATSVPDLGQWGNWTTTSGNDIGDRYYGPATIRYTTNMPHSTIQPDWDFAGRPIHIEGVRSETGTGMVYQIVLDEDNAKNPERAIDPTPVVDFISKLKVKEE